MTQRPSRPASPVAAARARLLCEDCGRTFGTAQAMAQHRRDTHDNPDWSSGKRKAPQIPLCPMCGEPAQLSDGKFGIRAECCGFWSWGLKPLVSKGTHIARIQAHAAFDRVWKSGRMSRGEAYRRLALLMGMPQRKCHISMMDYETALRVPAVLERSAIFDSDRFGKEQVT